MKRKTFAEDAQEGIQEELRSSRVNGVVEGDEVSSI